jgi:hypothetical protein
LFSSVLLLKNQNEEAENIWCHVFRNCDEVCEGYSSPEEKEE